MSTMRDVAALAGVSGKTVSRVINGAEYVSDDVRGRVERAIGELRYVPNMLSQTFRTGRDSAIGIAVPDLVDPFFGAVVQAVADEARRRSTATLVTTLGADPAQEQAAVQALLRRQVAGLVIAPVSADQSYLADAGTPMVFVDRPPRKLSADSVVEDDTGGAVLAVEHLIALGHRRIAFLGNAEAVHTTDRRRAGYRQALAAADLTADPDLEQFHQQSGRTVEQALDAVLIPGSAATAVFSSDSRTSVALVPALHTRGRTDLAVVSFGDFPMAASLIPSVTVLDQDPLRLGRTAAERLFARMDRPELRPRRQVLPVRLVVRDSSTPAPRVARSRRPARIPAAAPRAAASPTTASPTTASRTTASRTTASQTTASQTTRHTAGSPTTKGPS